MIGRTTLFALCFLNTFTCAQNTPKHLEFDVASIKQNKSGDRRMNSNFPLGPGGIYSANGGVFSATNMPLWMYILFAYKMTSDELRSMLDQLPGWVMDERFDIEAKTENSKVSKDEMRLMMQSLLADRTRLVVHTAVEEVPVFALTLVHPGKLGPKLRPHPADDTTCSNASPAANSPRTNPDGFPVACGGMVDIPTSAPGRIGAGYRNVPLSLIALQMSDVSAGGAERPVIDRTGLSGNYDMLIEFAPDFQQDATQVEPSGPSFEQALAAQDGLKLVPQKGMVRKIIVDHIERPSAN